MKKQTKKAPAKAKAPDPLKAINQRLRTIDVQTTRLSVSILHRIDDLERLIGMINERIDAQRMEGYALAQAKVDREQDTPKPTGLQPGDYTDASKGTADALTAMGFKWWKCGEEFNYIWWDHRDKEMLRVKHTNDHRITPSEFLSRAAVTANELGLEPKKVDAWVPKVGDVVVAIDAGLSCDLEVGSTYMVTGYDGQYVKIDHPHCIYGWFLSRFRPATDAEITAHLAKIEAAKPVGFGTWVEFDGEKTWRVVTDNDAGTGYWIMARPHDGATTRAHRSSFTVLDPQP